MSSFEDVLNCAYREFANQLMAPKVACQRCHGWGKVAVYPAFNRCGSSKAEQIVCSDCNGSGRVPIS